MKRLLGALFTITLVMVMVGTLYAEEGQYNEEGKPFPGEKSYYGPVVGITTVIRTSGDGDGSIKERNYYTSTHFTVKAVNDQLTLTTEEIENGNGKDMSAMIAVVQEAFTSGQMIVVAKRPDYVTLQHLYNALEELEKKLAQLPEERLQRLTALKDEFSSAVKKLYALFKDGQITQEEYIKKIRELYRNYFAARKEVEDWYAATKEQLYDQIASLEEDIEDIRSNPKLHSVSIRKAIESTTNE